MVWGLRGLYAWSTIIADQVYTSDQKRRRSEHLKAGGAQNNAEYTVNGNLWLAPLVPDNDQSLIQQEKY